MLRNLRFLNGQSNPGNTTAPGHHCAGENTDVVTPTLK